MISPVVFMAWVAMGSREGASFSLCCVVTCFECVAVCVPMFRVSTSD